MNEQPITTMEQWIASKVAYILGVEGSAIDVEEDLAAVGLDSITSLELVDELEAQVGTPMSPALLQEHRSIRALASAVAKDSLR